jgi:hypothetical protein
MNILAAIVISICLLPSTGFCFSDREVFDLLSQKSKAINHFPFHVFIADKDTTFEGVALPVSAYDFFQPVYDELQFKQPDEIFATYQFSQGNRWQWFLLRVPNMYTSNGIDIWTFDREQNVWQKPMKIAESWGDGEDTIDVHAWIEDLDHDGDLDIVERRRESFPGPEGDVNEWIIKMKLRIFLWEKDHFEDVTRNAFDKLHLTFDIEKYHVKEWKRDW